VLVTLLEMVWAARGATIVVEVRSLLVLLVVLVGPEPWPGDDAGVVALLYPNEATAGGDCAVAFEHRVCRRETATILNAVKYGSFTIEGPRLEKTELTLTLLSHLAA